MLDLAYIDAGSGSLIIQAIIASAIAIPLFFRHQIGRFIPAWRRPADKSAGSTPPRDDAAKRG